MQRQRMQRGMEGRGAEGLGRGAGMLRREERDGALRRGGRAVWRAGRFRTIVITLQLHALSKRNAAMREVLRLQGQAAVRAAPAGQEPSRAPRRHTAAASRAPSALLLPHSSPCRSSAAHWAPWAGQHRFWAPSCCWQRACRRLRRVGWPKQATLSSLQAQGQRLRLRRASQTARRLRRRRRRPPLLLPCLPPRPLPQRPLPSPWPRQPRLGRPQPRVPRPRCKPLAGDPAPARQTA